MLYFLGLYTPDPRAADVPPTPEHMDDMRRFVEQAMADGWLLRTGPLLRSQNNARISLTDDSFTVTDGPLPDRREVGWALLRAQSKAELVEATKGFLKAAGGGQADMFEIMGPSEPAAAG